MSATAPIAPRLACTFRFRHPQRERETCGLPVLVERLGHDPLCPWHDLEARPPGFDVKRELEEQLQRPDHWLEGAKLGMENLRQLAGNGARIPGADLEGTELDGAQFHKAILDDASLISAIMPGAQLSYASLVGAKLDAAQLSGADLTHCNLSGARLHGTTLERASLYGITLSAQTVFLGVSWGTIGELIYQHFEEAASVFRVLRTHFRSLSHLREAERFYYSEMTALHLRAINAEFLPDRNWLRQMYSWISGIRNPIMAGKWIKWAVHRWVWGYGVRPARTLFWMLLVVMLFGLVVFPWVGMLEGGMLTYDLRSGLALSVVTFATLGYGNRTPCGPHGELLGGLEATLGVLLMSMFIVALATRHVHVA